MKRLFSVLLCFAIFMGLLSVGVYAKSTKIDHGLFPEDEILISQEIQFLPNGSSLVISISQISNSSRATTRTVSGTKTYSCRNGDGEIMWQFMVHGTFSVVEGVSSTCTAVSHSYNISESSRSYVTGSSSRSGNKAIGHGEFKKKILLITVDTRECDVTLTCSANGVLS